MTPVGATASSWLVSRERTRRAELGLNARLRPFCLGTLPQCAASSDCWNFVDAALTASRWAAAVFAGAAVLWLEDFFPLRVRSSRSAQVGAVLHGRRPRRPMPLRSRFGDPDAGWGRGRQLTGSRAAGVRSRPGSSCASSEPLGVARPSRASLRSYPRVARRRAGGRDQGCPIPSRSRPPCHPSTGRC
jgi:hypothetical protein